MLGKGKKFSLEKVAPSLMDMQLIESGEGTPTTPNQTIDEGNVGSSVIMGAVDPLALKRDKLLQHGTYLSDYFNLTHCMQNAQYVLGKNLTLVAQIKQLDEVFEDVKRVGLDFLKSHLNLFSKQELEIEKQKLAKELSDASPFAGDAEGAVAMLRSRKLRKLSAGDNLEYLESLLNIAFEKSERELFKRVIVDAADKHDKFCDNVKKAKNDCFSNMFAPSVCHEHKRLKVLKPLIQNCKDVDEVFCIMRRFFSFSLPGDETSTNIIKEPKVDNYSFAAFLMNELKNIKGYSLEPLFVKEMKRGLRMSEVDDSDFIFGCDFHEEIYRNERIRFVSGLKKAGITLVILPAITDDYVIIPRCNRGK